jgi:hypothetical protein
MDTLYFIGFCGLVSVLIFWAMRNDDGGDYSRKPGDGKFRPLNKNDDGK